MQTGSVTRHGRGWRGHWREGKGKDAKRHSTETWAKKGEARAALNQELDRLALGARYRAPITLRELAERFLDQYVASPQTVKYARRRLSGRWTRSETPRRATLPPNRYSGSWRASTGRRGGTTSPHPSDGLRFGVATARRHEPGQLVKSPCRFGSSGCCRSDRRGRPRRRGVGKWGALVVFMADTGARPGEALRSSSGTSTWTPRTLNSPARRPSAWRTVHMTSRASTPCGPRRGRLPSAASSTSTAAPSRGSTSPERCGTPALELAGLEKRPPYSLRHTSRCTLSRPACRSRRRPGDGARVDERTFAVYGGWCRRWAPTPLRSANRGRRAPEIPWRPTEAGTPLIESDCRVPLPALPSGRRAARNGMDRRQAT